MQERFKERGFPKYFFWVLKHSLTAKAKKKKKRKAGSKEKSLSLSLVSCYF